MKHSLEYKGFEITMVRGSNWAYVDFKNGRLPVPYFSAQGAKRAITNHLKRRG